MQRRLALWWGTEIVWQTVSSPEMAPLSLYNAVSRDLMQGL